MRGLEGVEGKKDQEGMVEVNKMRDGGLTDHYEVGKAGKEGSGRDKAASKEGFHYHIVYFHPVGTSSSSVD